MYGIDVRGAAVVALLAAACSGGGGGGGGGPVTPQTGSVAGQVTAGGAGMAGVQVAVQGGGSATTDAAGNYRIDNVAAGSRTVTVTPPAGWITSSLADPPSKGVAVAAGQTATVGWGLKRGMVVTAGGTSFTPGAVSVAAGQTVRWVAADGGHTVTPDNPGQPGAWSGAALSAAGFEHTFSAAGTYGYHCVPHQVSGMTGTVTVTP